MYAALEDAMRNGRDIAKAGMAQGAAGFSPMKNAPVKWCEKCQAEQPYLNDGDFDICCVCDQPMLSEADKEHLDDVEDATRRSGSDGIIGV